MRVEKEGLDLEVGWTGSRQEADDLHRVGAAVQCLWFYQLCRIGFTSYRFYPLMLQSQSGLVQEVIPSAISPSSLSDGYINETQGLVVKNFEGCKPCPSMEEKLVSPHN